MIARRSIAFLILWYCAMSGAFRGVAQEGTGKIAPEVFICREMPEACIEFLTNGVYYLRTGIGCYASGNWQAGGDSVVLAGRAGWPARFDGIGGVLKDNEGRTWVRRVQMIHSANLRPVFVKVFDGETERPITGFLCEYWIEMQDVRIYSSNTQPWRVRAVDGVVSIDAPETCDLTVCISAQDYVNAFGNWATFTVGPDSADREFDISLERGRKVAGRVLDADTGGTIKGVRISPLVLESPVIVPDHVREVESGEQGEFELHGVDPELGIRALHPLYAELRVDDLDKRADRDGAWSMKLDLRMSKGRTVGGMVCSPGGLPLAGVSVKDDIGRNVFTSKDGKFSIGGLPLGRQGIDEEAALTFELPGYISRNIPASDCDRHHPIVLDPLFEVRGRVTSADGKMVAGAMVYAGEGENPAAADCVHAMTGGSNGEFVVRLPSGGTNWFGVRAGGGAFWNGRIDVRREMQPLTVKLTGGSSVSGVVRGRGSAEMESMVYMIPQTHNSESPAGGEESGLQKFGRMETVIKPDGGFGFCNVAPGSYVLGIAGPSPVEYTVAVREGAAICLGNLDTETSGSVVGRICLPRDEGSGGWAFVDGTLGFDAERDVLRPFKADENGGFELHGLPAGPAWICLPDDAGSGVRSSHGCTLRVCKNRTTTIELYEQDKNEDVAFQVRVRDGATGQWAAAVGVFYRAEEQSDLTFCLALEPPIGHPGRLPDTVLARMEGSNSQLVVTDVQPGAYHARLKACFENQVVSVWQSDIVVTSGVNGVNVVLGGGSINGRIASEDSRNAIVCATDARGDIRYGMTGPGNRFCVPFVPTGIWSVVIYADDAGWGHADGVKVADSAVDLGAVSLRHGGGVSGILWSNLEKRMREYTVGAVDDCGREIACRMPVAGNNGERYEFRNLWPGRWRIKLIGDGVELRSVMTEIVNGCHVHAELRGM